MGTICYTTIIKWDLCCPPPPSRVEIHWTITSLRSFFAAGDEERAKTSELYWWADAMFRLQAQVDLFEMIVCIIYQGLPVKFAKRKVKNKIKWQSDNENTIVKQWFQLLVLFHNYISGLWLVPDQCEQAGEKKGRACSVDVASRESWLANNHSAEIHLEKKKKKKRILSWILLLRLPPFHTVDTHIHSADAPICKCPQLHNVSRVIHSLSYPKLSPVLGNYRGLERFHCHTAAANSSSERSDGGTQRKNIQMRIKCRIWVDYG